MITRHADLIREHFREKYALIQMKKHLAWYTEGLPYGRNCRVALFASRLAATRSGRALRKEVLETRASPARTARSDALAAAPGPTAAVIAGPG